jgi:hypothetical protein
LFPCIIDDNKPHFSVKRLLAVAHLLVAVLGRSAVDSDDETFMLHGLEVGVQRELTLCHSVVSRGRQSKK